MTRRPPLHSYLIDWRRQLAVAPLADAVIEHAQRDPYFDLDGYMRRWWLQRPVQHGGPTPHSARIHELLRSDDSRHMHDHPWDCTSIVLRGGYWDVTPISQDQPCDRDHLPLYQTWRWCGPGSVVHRRAEDRHFLILPPGRTCTSMFLMGEKRREWGFHVPYAPGQWVHWEKYEAFVAKWGVAA